MNTNRSPHDNEGHVHERRRMGWLLSDALDFIDQHQYAAMAEGWCLCLAGGVLNKRHSINDLDLVAYPRLPRLRSADLVRLFPEGEWKGTPVGRLYRFQVDRGQRSYAVVELCFVEEEE